MSLTIKGYISSKKIQNIEFPQRFQNLVIRDYCIKNNLRLLLSSTEYRMDNSFIILKHLLNNINEYDGIIFFSLFMLPIEINDRYHIYRQVFNSNKKLYFAYESKFIINFEDIDSVENIYIIDKYLKDI